MTTHVAGVNHSNDVIRQAMIHDFIKTEASVPDAWLVDYERCAPEDMWFAFPQIHLRN